MKKSLFRQSLLLAAALLLSPSLRAGYTVTVAASECDAPHTAVYQAGDELTVTAVPSEGYEFAGWSDGCLDNPRLITVSADADYRALFTPVLALFTVDLRAGVGGTVSGGGTFLSGTDITLLATPSTGYSFAGWSDGNQDNPRSLTVLSDLSLTASFLLDSFPVTLSADACAEPFSGIFYYGDEITLTASPSEGYAFVRWSDGSTDNPRLLTVSSALDLSAIFERNLFSITFLHPDGTVLQQSDVPVGELPAYGGSVPVKADDDSLTYAFAGWSPQISPVSGDASYTALFTSSLREFTLLVVGTPGRTEGSGTYAYGSSVVISAQPDSDYHFVGWSDGADDNPRTVTVLSDATYTAIFAPDCEEWAQWPIVRKYEWLLMLDVEAIAAMGYAVNPDDVSWYRVAGTDSTTPGDDVFVGTGFYLTIDRTLFGTGDYYAVVDVSASEGTLCNTFMRSEIVSYTSEVLGEPALLPTLASPLQELTLVGLDPAVSTDIRVYSPSGQLLWSSRSEGSPVVFLDAAPFPGCYLISLSSPAAHHTLRYLVR